MDMIDSGNEKSFAEMLDEGFSTPEYFEPGQQVEARIVRITDSSVFLDVGGKSEGYVSRAELLDENGEMTAEEGDTLKVYFLSAEHSEMLFTSTLGGGSAAQAHLEEAYASRIPVAGKVEKEIKGGFQITLGGKVRAFCPYSQMDKRRIEDPEAMIGRELTFMISQYEESGRNIILSRRQLLEEESRRQMEDLKETLEIGTVVTGQITSIREFGAFVDIGGIEGLLPISEIGWGRVEDINSKLEVGQKVQVAVLKLDWDKERFSFSLKETLPDPWQLAVGKFPEGTFHSGRVERLAPFGAFVNLAEGVDGLLHISGLAGGRRINHPREVLSEGEIVEVRVDSVDPVQRRISLTLAAAVKEVEEEEKVVKEVREFISETESKSSGSMGTLGDLLKKKLEKGGK